MELMKLKYYKRSAVISVSLIHPVKQRITQPPASFDAFIPRLEPWVQVAGLISSRLLTAPTKCLKYNVIKIEDYELKCFSIPSWTIKNWFYRILHNKEIFFHKTSRIVLIRNSRSCSALISVISRILHCTNFTLSTRYISVSICCPDLVSTFTLR